MGKPDKVKVHFFADNGQIKGRIIEDLSGQGRCKLVLIDRSYKGPAPKPGDEREVEIVKDTRLDDPTRGVMFVQLPKEDRRVPYAPSPRVNACKKLGLDYSKVREDLKKLEHDSYFNRDLTDQQIGRARLMREDLEKRLKDATDRNEAIAYHAWYAEISRLSEKHMDAFNDAGRAPQKIYDLQDLIPRSGVEDAERTIRNAHPDTARLNEILPQIREALLLHELPLIKSGVPREAKLPSDDQFGEGAREYWEREIAKLNDWVGQIKALVVELRPVVDEFRQLLGYESTRERAESQGRVKEEQRRQERFRREDDDRFRDSFRGSSLARRLLNEEDGAAPSHEDVD